jgi:SAM-dependent methyltransferase
MNVDSLFRNLRQKWRVPSLLTNVLRSEFVWRASGAAYWSAVIATTGTYSAKRTYLQSFSDRIDQVRSYFPPSSCVLEFGTGLGGNLLALSSSVRAGYGIDVNKFYVKIAERLRRRQGSQNVMFVAYDGKNLPPLTSVDAAFSFGVFERIPKSMVRDYIRQLSSIVKPGGWLLLYFLTESSKSRGFGGILGPEAYEYWNSEELEDLWKSNGLSLVRTLLEYPGGGDTFVLRRAAKGQPKMDLDSSQPRVGIPGWA